MMIYLNTRVPSRDLPPRRERLGPARLRLVVRERCMRPAGHPHTEVSVGAARRSGYARHYLPPSAGSRPFPGDFRSMLFHRSRPDKLSGSGQSSRAMEAPSASSKPVHINGPAPPPPGRQCRRLIEWA